VLGTRPNRMRTTMSLGACGRRHTDRMRCRVWLDERVCVVCAVARLASCLPFRRPLRGPTSRGRPAQRREGRRPTRRDESKPAGKRTNKRPTKGRTDRQATDRRSRTKQRDGLALTMVLERELADASQRVNSCDREPVQLSRASEGGTRRISKRRVSRECLWMLSPRPHSFTPRCSPQISPLDARQRTTDEQSFSLSTLRLAKRHSRVGECGATLR
jgi:hypothetical protein